MGFTDEEIVAALQGFLAECDGHNYGNAGLSTRITNPTADDLAERVEKDSAVIQKLLRRSLPLADKQTDGTPYVGKDWASLGIYQQIPTGIYNWGWGTVEELMDPATAAERFYTSFRQTTQLPGEPLVYRVQRTQRSQFDGVTINPNIGKPYPFAANYLARETTARQLLANPRFFTEGGVSVIDGGA